MHVYHVKKQQKNLQNCPVFTAVCDVLTGSRQEALLETRDPAWVLRTVAILAREKQDARLLALSAGFSLSRAPNAQRSQTDIAVNTEHRLAGIWNVRRPPPHPPTPRSSKSPVTGRGVATAGLPDAEGQEDILSLTPAATCGSRAVGGSVGRGAKHLGGGEPSGEPLSGRPV